jgi:hypothetical protein
MQFDLQYYLHMSISDYDNNDIKDNEWLHSKLYEQKEDEAKAREKKQ